MKKLLTSLLFLLTVAAIAQPTPVTPGGVTGKRVYTTIIIGIDTTTSPYSYTGVIQLDSGFKFKGQSQVFSHGTLPTKRYVDSIAALYEADTVILATKAYVDNGIDSLGALMGDLDTLFLDPYKIYAKDSTLNNWKSLMGFNDDTIVFRIDPSFATTTYLGFGNTSWGFGGLMLNSTGYHNAVFGGNGFQNNSTGYQNTGGGNRVFYSNTTGYQNSGFGQGAGFENTTGIQNCYFGWHSGLNLNSSTSSFFGAASGQGQTGTADANDGFGRESLYLLRNGTNNAAFARNSLRSLTDGTNNIGVGGQSGFSVTTGSFNFFGGFASGYTLTPANATTTGSYNTFLGNYSGSSIATQLNYSGTFGYASTVGRDSTYTFNSPRLRSVAIGNDSGDYTLHVFGTVGISTTPTSTNGTDNVLVKASTGQVMEVSRALFMANSDTVSNANITMGTVAHYSFDGSTATWTLPTIAASDGHTYFIKNRGSGNLIINTSGGGNELYDSAATNSITVAAGASVILHNDGTYFTTQ